MQSTLTARLLIGQNVVLTSSRFLWKRLKPSFRKPRYPFRGRFNHPLTTAGRLPRVEGIAEHRPRVRNVAVLRSGEDQRIASTKLQPQRGFPCVRTDCLWEETLVARLGSKTELGFAVPSAFVVHPRTFAAPVSRELGVRTRAVAAPAQGSSTPVVGISVARLQASGYCSSGSKPGSLRGRVK